MSETKDHTITDRGAAVGEGREALPVVPSTQPPTTSDTGDTPPLTTSDTSAKLTLTMSDITPAPAAVPGLDNDIQPDEAQFPLLEKSAAGTSDSGEKRTAKSEERTANSEERADSGEKRTANKPVKLCLHVMEDGVFCRIAALSGRQYCYRHLRLRGQQMRMARAIAQRQPYQVVLPPLDDMQAVQAALAHVAAALSAGLLERHRAGLLLYTLQQASSNLRFLARAEAQARARSNVAECAPPLSPSVGDGVGPSEPQRVVEEYPGFEAEFGLPPGLDLTLPPQVAFPPPQEAQATATATAAPGIHPLDRWTKEAIEREELEKQRPNMNEKTYNERIRKLNNVLQQRVTAHLRKEREAEWEAEAARRNAEDDEKVRTWHSMDKAQQQAFMEGVWTGRAEAAAEQQERRQQEARAKKPAASAGGEAALAGMGTVTENKAAK